MALIAFAGICLVGCKKDQKDFYLSDLQGLWQNDQTTTWYMRFTADQGDIAGCYWGREWGDFGDDVTEDDLFDPENYHGNGWFQYKLEKNGDFTYINMMDNKGADVPKSFKMITLTSSKMTFQNDLKEKKNFTKQ
jgi:hypothetical protein